MTSTGTWLSLPARTGGRDDRVPARLRQDLRDWLWYAARKPKDLTERVARRLRLRIQPEQTSDDEPYDYDCMYKAFVNGTPDSRLFEIIDAVLDLMPPTKRPEELGKLGRAFYTDHRAKLRQILEDGDAPYTVSADGRSLVRRASASSGTALSQALASAERSAQTGSAAQHLRSAWSAIHGRLQDPAKAYSEAIKAVEAAAHAVIEPRNPKATLGTMLGQLRSRPNAYASVFGPLGVTAATSMIEVLWKGQTSRHGGQTPTRNETQAEAVAAVHLAVLLVEWFASGAITAAP